MAWLPSKEYQERCTQLHRLRNSRKLLMHGAYRWMYQPAIDLITEKIKELEQKQNPNEKEEK